jgi:pimeloyl-ACP methyl ester carboxylesterase
MPFWMWSMQAGIAGAYQCIKAFSETDLTEDIKQIDIPTLVLHGDDDQIVPIADFRAAVFEADQEGHSESLSRRAARTYGDTSRSI